MSTPHLPERDAGEVDALVADRYLEALLAAAAGAPARLGIHDAAAVASDDLEPALRETALVLRRTLVRVHPSFRFEERLAERLAILAAAQASPALAAAGGATVIPFATQAAGGEPRPTQATGAGAAASARDICPDPLLDAVLRGDLDPSDAAAVARAAAGVDPADLEPDAVEPADAGAPDRRPLLVVGGAAITSAAISIVGVAYVAWRASRPASRDAGPAVLARAVVTGAVAARVRRAAEALAATELLGSA